MVGQSVDQCDSTRGLRNEVSALDGLGGPEALVAAAFLLA